MFQSLSVNFKIYLCFLFVSSVIGLLLFRRVSKQLKFVSILLCMTFISEMVSRMLSFKIDTSYPVYHFYTVAECLLLFAILYQMSEKSSRKILVLVVFSSLIIFSIINSIFFQGLYDYNSNVDLVKIPLTVLLSGLLIFDKINVTSADKYLLNADLVILIGIFWFNLSSFIFEASHNYLVKQGRNYFWLDQLHFYSNMLYYFLFIFSFFVYLKSREVGH
jgi:hypothetical protein